jgi:hypothetical protein
MIARRSTLRPEILPCAAAGASQCWGEDDDRRWEREPGARSARRDWTSRWRVPASSGQWEHRRGDAHDQPGLHPAGSGPVSPASTSSSTMRAETASLAAAWAASTSSTRPPTHSWATSATSAGRTSSAQQYFFWRVSDRDALYNKFGAVFRPGTGTKASLAGERFPVQRATVHVLGLHHRGGT